MVRDYPFRPCGIHHIMRSRLPPDALGYRGSSTASTLTGSVSPPRRAAEIGCGVGRMTRMLSKIFGHVTGVDISEEMIRQARQNTADLDNVDLVLGDGCTLAGLPGESYDFAFSFIVFQHIPAYSVMASYCREVFRVLKPGGLFTFQAQGYTDLSREELDTWVGHPISERED